MAWIKTVPEEEADARLRTLYDEVVDPVSQRVDNIMTIHSMHSERLVGHYGLYRAVMDSSPTLRKVEREMIALVVSRINKCQY